MILDWLSQNVVAMVAILFSVGTLTFNNFGNEVKTTTTILNRVDAIETRIETIPHLEKRTADLETRTAVTNQILVNLDESVTELNINTKELTKLVPVVAVLDQKVKNIEEDLGN